MSPARLGLEGRRRVVVAAPAGKGGGRCRRWGADQRRRGQSQTFHARGKAVPPLHTAGTAPALTGGGRGGGGGKVGPDPSRQTTVIAAGISAAAAQSLHNFGRHVITITATVSRRRQEEGEKLGVVGLEAGHDCPF